MECGSTETGFRERGREVAVLEECSRDHVTGWDHLLPGPVTLDAVVLVATVVSGSVCCSGGPADLDHTC
ncbi:hypothetical protein [Umezawaea beigongshangensis]|uniref:hypothetical protein n=1 Tax=Umezawaea beigongshangensis TaxID=2780383 RepID=UPI0018F1B20B|nr:hypothetical protein [Umezawaea beigongshangensis]